MTYTKNRYLPGSARLQRFLALLDLYYSFYSEQILKFMLPQNPTNSAAALLKGGVP